MAGLLVEVVMDELQMLIRKLLPLLVLWLCG